MTRELACRDAGLDCDEVIRGGSDDEVMGKAATHASERHPDLELTPETQAKLEGLIHDA